ncbi:hypothetical protein KVR01_007984 [Diaporthe batatas]|uniref:uncharacterized protein n=1 Tax=Diaporthe batatas TaxID=748121 RepID=UPI001D03C19C|nr:uncharacterized protein KVR01_007984 [Diaporthe batatas]KAG8162219.1 hypothetical protein KVR01_007984 [Diaporthe batatas]
MTWHSIALGLATFAGLGLLYGVSVALFSPLRKIPGPVAARFTNLFHLNHIHHKCFHYENKALHNNYRPLLYLNENLISIDDPRALKPIYEVGSRFPKSDWYTAWIAPGPNGHKGGREWNVRRHGDKAEVWEKGTTRDFLDRLLDKHEDNPDKTTMYHVFLVGLANINAGSDTTAATKLREEIDSFTAQGQLSARLTFKETQRMPYLDAVVKEALRLHSAVGLPLWRVVPQGGLDIAGQYLPAGTNVGINAWVAHFNEGVWGDDARQFRPERWLEA